MKDHPEFLDSMAQYVESRLAEWDAAHPQPEHPHSSAIPEVPEPTVALHHNGYLILLANGNGMKIHVTTPKGNMDIFFNIGQISGLIEQLLSLEVYLQEYRDFKNDNAALDAWNTERGSLVQYWRKEFIAKNEHRDLVAEGAE